MGDLSIIKLGRTLFYNYMCKKISFSSKNLMFMDKCYATFKFVLQAIMLKS